jgi:hypothetical protein
MRPLVAVVVQSVTFYPSHVDADAVSVLQLLFALGFLAAVATITFMACKPEAETELLGKKSAAKGRGNDGDNMDWVSTSSYVCVRNVDCLLRLQFCVVCVCVHRTTSL